MNTMTKKSQAKKPFHLRPAAIIPTLAVVLLCAHTGEAAEFTYNGDTGPGFWAELDDAWLSCGDDSGQSPIAIDATRPGTGLVALQSIVNLVGTPISLTNNGHTLENWATMSAAQFERFNDILGNNFRPQQPLAGRTILKARGK